MGYKMHVHYSEDEHVQYDHDHSDGSTQEDSEVVHEHNAHGRDTWVGFRGARGTDEGWDGGLDGPVGPPGSDEDELQATFGMGNTRVNWSFVPQPTDHNGGVWKIENSPGKTTALVCNCGWAYAVPDGMGIKEAGNLFADHVR